MNVLPIALLHAALRDGDPEWNLAEIARLARQAAGEGARLMVAPELSASGYISGGREAAAPFAETFGGPTARMLAAVAKERAIYICTGFCEFDTRSGQYFNSALTFGPAGLLVGHHRKVRNEQRWAAPGAVTPMSRFETEWGAIGVLVCSDTYYGLLPRTQALRGADLLIVPANWPESGLDPREVWSARAIENGIGLVACNRSGRGVLDCSQAHSYAVSSDGTVLQDFESPVSAIAHVSYPLIDGKLERQPRARALATRKPRDYQALASPAAGDVPPDGPLILECVARGVTPGPAPGTAHRVLGMSDDAAPTADGLTVVVAQNDGRAFLLTRQGHAESPEIVDFGPARIAFVDAAAMVHPEMSTSLVKRGCNLAVTATRNGPGDCHRLLLGIKSTERLAVMILGPDGGIICAPPAGHERWREVSTEATGACSMEFETAYIRKWSFVEPLDLEALLRL